ncbi:MAG: DNA polymerase II [Thermoanaerobaculia bacterium]
MSNPVRGFILQPTYRIESGRPVVHLFGKLETGESFLVRDGRLVPHFWVRAADGERAGALVAEPLAESDRVTFAGEPVLRVEVPTPPDTPPLRDRLQRSGVQCYEADVRFAMRYLIDKGIRGSLKIDGEGHEGTGIDRVFEDPELGPADWTPELTVLSFDIETDPKAARVLSIGLFGCGAAEVLLLTPKGLSAPDGAVPCSSEAELLRAFCRRVQELDPDVLTGWNADDFDFPVLLRRADDLDVPFILGRGPGTVRLLEGRGPRQATQVIIPGRLVLDGIQLLRGSFIKMERYSLDFVAREVLGEGKIFTGEHRAEEILQAFKEDRERFVEYNLADARLVTEILAKLELVELAVERSRLTGLPPDRVSSSVAAFDFLYLTELGKMKVVAPTVGSGDETGQSTAGGYVFKPQAGLYENVLVFDVNSLYPSLIRSFQIDPLGYVEQPRPEDDLIVAPNGACFRREPGILTRMLDELFPRREAAKQAGDKVTSHAIKILMNSFFGVLGTPVCRFYNPEVANAITSFGRELLLWSRDHIEARGLRVLYGDTDSLFVEAGVEEPETALELAAELVDELNRSLAGHLRESWQVESRLEVELEQLYLRLFLPPVRHGTAGARKRYAGLVRDGDEKRVVFTGLEVVRRDWTALARRTQRELYERLFFDRPVEDHLRQVVADLREGRLDTELVYRKALRKAPEAYVSTTPPHVAAARKMSGRPGRLISYVITTGGPEPADEQQSPFDYQHYVDKQIRPVAEPILSHLGLGFDVVVGDDKQMALF